MCTKSMFLTGAFLACVGAVPDSFSVEGLSKVHDAMSGLRKQLSTFLKPHRRLAEAVSRRSYDRGARRQLTDAAGQYCVWDGASCTPSLTTQSALMNDMPANSVIKKAYDKCQPCEGKAEDMCVHAHCYWDATDQECACQTSDAEMQNLMGAIFHTNCCGWVGVMLDASAKCSGESRTTCPVNAGCSLSSSYAVPDNADVGDSCAMLDECSMDSDASLQAMCPGVSDVQAMTSGCTPSDTTTDFNTQIDSMTSCVKGQCSMLGEMLEVTYACLKLTSQTACTGNANCAWKPDETACEPILDKMMEVSIPDGCPYKPIMTNLGSCDAGTKAACESQQQCIWGEDMECSDASSPNVVMKSKCDTHPSNMFKQMAEATCDADTTAFAELMIAAQACVATTEDACTSVTAPDPIECKRVSAQCASEEPDASAAAPFAVATLTLACILVHAWPGLSA